MCLKWAHIIHEHLTMLMLFYRNIRSLILELQWKKIYLPTFLTYYSVQLNVSNC